MSERLSIGAIGCQGIIDVGQGQDLSAHGNCISGKVIGVSAAVPVFVVMANQGNGILEEFAAA